MEDEGVPWKKEEIARPDGRRPASHRFEGWWYQLCQIGRHGLPAVVMVSIK